MSDWIHVCSLDELEEEEMCLVRVAENPVVVYWTEDGVYATAGRCTHEQAPLIDGYLSGTVIECPRHNARFNVCTGKALRRPARDNLETYRTKVEGGEVYVAAAPG